MIVTCNRYANSIYAGNTCQSAPGSDRNTMRYLHRGNVFAPRGSELFACPTICSDRTHYPFGEFGSKSLCGDHDPSAVVVLIALFQLEWVLEIAGFRCDEPIQYTFSGTGSGNVGSSGFSDASITISFPATGAMSSAPLSTPLWDDYGYRGHWKHHRNRLDADVLFGPLFNASLAPLINSTM